MQLFHRKMGLVFSRYSWSPAGCCTNGSTLPHPWTTLAQVSSCTAAVIFNNLLWQIPHLAFQIFQNNKSWCCALKSFYFAEVSEMLARAPDVKSPTSRASIYFILTYYTVLEGNCLL